MVAKPAVQGNARAGSEEDASIAVVGLACRLPGAGGPDEYWELLRDGRDAVGEAPPHRRDMEADAAKAGHHAWRAGYLDRIDEFDAGFFGISPREAAAMDPQQRLLLELSWEALEDAGIVPAQLHGTQTGVYAAAIWDDYAELTHRQHAALTHHSFSGTQRSMLANRISYTLELTGPSLTVDTGQSSSLVAVHLACESLRRGECATALVGGVNLMIGSNLKL